MEITKDILEKASKDLESNFPQDDIEAKSACKFLLDYKDILIYWTFDKIQSLLLDIINGDIQKPLELIVNDMDPDAILEALDKNAQEFMKLSKKQALQNKMIKQIISFTKENTIKIATLIIISILRSYLPIQIAYPTEW